MVSVAQRQHHQSYPHPGWVEHDAREIWEITRELVPQALADAGVEASQVVALGVTNQRETIVVWDRATGEPVAPAIVWQDVRTSDRLGELTDDVDRAWLTSARACRCRRTPPARRCAGCSTRCRRALARGRPGEAAVRHHGHWLVWNLTGGLHVTDTTNASRTMLMDLETLAWDPDLLACMHVPASMLPEIRPSIGVVGTTRDPVPGIPIGALVGDQQASLLGQTAVERGDAKCTFGTGSFLLMNTGPDIVRSRAGLITTVAATAEGEAPAYALEGSVAVSGSLVEWCRTSLGLVRSAPEIETLARTVDDNGGCVIVPAFSGLHAPHWEARAQGVVLGLTSYIEKGHIARAVLEAVAWQAKDVVVAMIQDAGAAMAFLAVDGGMTANNLLMQTVADVLDVPVVRPMMAESVSLGAAYAAGLSVGYWPDRSVLRSHWSRAAEWRPEMTAEERGRRHAAWQDAVGLSIGWARRP